MLTFHLIVALLCGWLQREQENVLAFLREENRVLKASRVGDLVEAGDVLWEGRILICDRVPTWTHAMEELLRTAGVRVVRTPPAAPNCNAHPERFVRSIKEECLERIVPLGEWHLRRTVREFVQHYHAERNHQGIGNEWNDLLRSEQQVAFDGVSASAAFSATTIALPRRRARPSNMGYYAVLCADR